MTLLGNTLPVKTQKSIVLVTVEAEGLCRGCGADILWCRTPAGKMMPVDPPEEDEQAVTHFATCPDEKQFRRG